MRKIAFACLTLLFSITIASASGKPAHIKPLDTPNTARWYKIFWGGVHVADLKAEIKGNRFNANIDSYGIVKKVSKYRSRTETNFSANGQYLPVSFIAEFNQRQGGKTINLHYTKTGTIAKEQVTPPDKRGKRPAVSENKKENAFDPLTSALLARQMIQQSLKTGQKKFSIPMYDGRRLASLDFTIHGRMEDKINGKKYKLVKISFNRRPIEGYTNNELKRMKGEEPVMTVYLSDDTLLLPIKAEADASLGKAVLLLERACESLAECG